MARPQFYAKVVHIPKTVKAVTERWVRIFPDTGDGYRLYDPLNEVELGRILFDVSDNWIYDGDNLSVEEQVEVEGAISRHEREMNQLLRSLHEHC